MEDELYEENNNISQIRNDNTKHEDEEKESDNDSTISNTNSYSNSTTNNNSKHRKDYTKIDNNEENLKVINRLRKNNLNMIKSKDNLNCLFDDIIINDRIL